jgi:catalase
MGRLVIKSVAADATGECVAITYNPMILPKGVEPSADPMLAARAAPYVVGLGRRLGEGAKQ